MIYMACGIVGLIGAAVAFGRKDERWLILGAALYFLAIFAAAIHSFHGTVQ